MPTNSVQWVYCSYEAFYYVMAVATLSQQQDLICWTKNNKTKDENELVRKLLVKRLSWEERSFYGKK